MIFRRRTGLRIRITWARPGPATAVRQELGLGLELELGLELGLELELGLGLELGLEPGRLRIRAWAMPADLTTEVVRKGERRSLSLTTNMGKWRNR